MDRSSICGVITQTCWGWVGGFRSRLTWECTTLMSNRKCASNNTENYCGCHNETEASQACTPVSGTCTAMLLARLYVSCKSVTQSYNLEIGCNKCSTTCSFHLHAYKSTGRVSGSVWVSALPWRLGSMVRVLHLFINSEVCVWLTRVCSTSPALTAAKNSPSLHN